MVPTSSIWYPTPHIMYRMSQNISPPSVRRLLYQDLQSGQNKKCAAVELDNVELDNREGLAGQPSHFKRIKEPNGRNEPKTELVSDFLFLKENGDDSTQKATTLKLIEKSNTLT